MLTIDINCDVGEGIDNEEELMPYISSCNIACGAHAGDSSTIDRVISVARQHRVKVGAHPSFPDRKNFGRKVMRISWDALAASLIEQIQRMQERLGGEQLHHIKAHGALYNASATDHDIAKVLVHAVKKTAADTILYVPGNSVIEQLALQHRLNIKYEVFADRNYQDDLRLVSRTQRNAVITDKEEVLRHLSRMVIDQRVKTVSNRLVPIRAETGCVHGDNEAAREIVRYIYQELPRKGVAIA